MWSKFFYSKNERNSSIKWKCCYNQLEMVDDWNKQLFCWFFATNGREITHTKIYIPNYRRPILYNMSHTHTMFTTINQFILLIDWCHRSAKNIHTWEKNWNSNYFMWRYFSKMVYFRTFESGSHFQRNIKWFSAISKCDKTVANPKITHNASERRGEMWKNVITKHKTHSNW